MELDTLIRARVTSAEKQALIAKASTWGLNLSEYMRMLLVLHDPPRQVTDVSWETYSRLGEVYGQLRRAVSDFNQLSRIANTQNKIPDDLSQELKNMDKILQELQQVLLELRSQIDRP
jgi:chemotaxis protein histidine kinase CheA